MHDRVDNELHPPASSEDCHKMSSMCSYPKGNVFVRFTVLESKTRPLYSSVIMVDLDNNGSTHPRIQLNIGIRLDNSFMLNRDYQNATIWDMQSQIGYSVVLYVHFTSKRVISCHLIHKVVISVWISFWILCKCWLEDEADLPFVLGSLWSFFHFILLFWNQILICRSERQSVWAISIRRLLVKYLLKWNSFSNSKTCCLV